jgi:hypothetical protein
VKHAVNTARSSRYPPTALHTDLHRSEDESYQAYVRWVTKPSCTPEDLPELTNCHIPRANFAGEIRKADNTPGNMNGSTHDLQQAHTIASATFNQKSVTAVLGIQGHPLTYTVLMDTGAQVCIIALRIVPTGMKIHPLVTPMRIGGFQTGSPLNVIGKVFIRWTSPCGAVFPNTLTYVIDQTVHDAILSKDWMTRMYVSWNMSQKGDSISLQARGKRIQFKTTVQPAPVHIQVISDPTPAPAIESELELPTVDQPDLLLDAMGNNTNHQPRLRTVRETVIPPRCRIDVIASVEEGE